MVPYFLMNAAGKEMRCKMSWWVARLINVDGAHWRHCTFGSSWMTLNCISLYPYLNWLNSPSLYHCILGRGEIKFSKENGYGEERASMRSRGSSVIKYGAKINLQPWVFCNYFCTIGLLLKVFLKVITSWINRISLQFFFLITLLLNQPICTKSPVGLFWIYEIDWKLTSRFSQRNRVA